MSWNYRIGKKRFDGFDPKLHDPEDEYTYGLYEVFYADEEQTKIHLISQDTIAPFGLDAGELMRDHEFMGIAFSKPVIDIDDIEFVERDD